MVMYSIPDNLSVTNKNAFTNILIKELLFHQLQLGLSLDMIARASLTRQVPQNRIQVFKYTGWAIKMERHTSHNMSLQ